MKALLDTHAWLWWLTDDEKLSPRARELIGNEASELLVSAASLWEVATKHRLGKLGLAAEAVDRLPSLLLEEGFAPLPITWAHALRAGQYRQPHRDPFDRMLAAQAELERIPLVSCDAALAQFGVTLVW